MRSARCGSRPDDRVPPDLGRDRPGRDPAQRGGVDAARRRPDGGRQGRRLRARGRARRPRGARGRRDLGRRGARGGGDGPARRRHRRADPRDVRGAAGVRGDRDRGPAHPHPVLRRRADAAGRGRARGTDRRAREGRHRDAPGRGLAARGGAGVRRAGRPGRARRGGALDPLRLERGSTRRRPSGSSSASSRPRTPSARPAWSRACSTRRTARPRSCTRRAGSTSCGRGSPCTGSRRRRDRRGPRLTARALVALARELRQAPARGRAPVVRPPLRAGARRVDRDRADRVRRRAAARGHRRGPS